MTSREPIRGIYFDLWNTLAFTEGSPNPIVALASAFGLYPGPAWRRIMERAIMTRRLAGIGEAIEAIAAATGRAISDGSSRRDLILMWGAASNRNRLYADTLPGLEALRRSRSGGLPYRLGILSNTQSFDLDFLDRAGLIPLMDAVCLSCDCGLLKPDPEIYRHAASRIGLLPEQILMVGDNPEDDIDGPRRAGFQAALLDRSRGGPETGSGALASISEIPVLLTASSP